MLNPISTLDTLSESTVHDLAAPVLGAAYMANTAYTYAIAGAFALVAIWKLARQVQGWHRRRRQAVGRELDNVEDLLR